MEQTIRSGGIVRTFRLEVPRRYNAEVPAPLVFLFHGAGASAAFQSGYTNFPRVGHQRGLIFVTPDAVGHLWQLPSQRQPPVDVKFVSDLTAHIEAAYCVDLNRVFAAGYSRGARLASDIACANPRAFAAIALVALEARSKRCSPISVIAFHGTNDPQVPYAHASTIVDSKGALANMTDWAELDGCLTHPIIEKLGTTVEHRSYPQCAAGTNVELYTILGAGHIWPGAKINFPQLGVWVHTIDANDEIIHFFAAHPRHSN